MCACVVLKELMWLYFVPAILLRNVNTLQCVTLHLHPCNYHVYLNWTCLTVNLKPLWNVCGEPRPAQFGISTESTNHICTNYI